MVELIDARTANAEQVEEWSRGLASQGAAAYNAFLQTKSATNAIRAKSPAAWNTRVVYHIVVDRFNNANPNIDNQGLPSYQIAQTALGSTEFPDVYRYKHGGDFAGIQARLDYLSELGVGTIFLSSFLKTDAWEVSHTCASSFLETDTGYGSLRDLQELIHAAHARDMLVVADWPADSLCDADTLYHATAQPKFNMCVDKMTETEIAGDEPVTDGQGSLAFGARFFSPFAHDRYMARCGPSPSSSSPFSDDPALQRRSVSSGGDGGADASVESAVAHELVREKVFGDALGGGSFKVNMHTEHVPAMLARMATYWVGAVDLDGIRIRGVDRVAQCKYIPNTPCRYSFRSIHSLIRSMGFPQV
jgi:hypothetical protein